MAPHACDRHGGLLAVTRDLCRLSFCKSLQQWFGLIRLAGDEQIQRLAQVCVAGLGPSRDIADGLATDR